jgi:hypothetical protein
VSLSAQQQRVLNLIDEKELVELTVAMSSRWMYALVAMEVCGTEG